MKTSMGGFTVQAAGSCGSLWPCLLLGANTGCRGWHSADDTAGGPADAGMDFSSLLLFQLPLPPRLEGQPW